MTPDSRPPAGNPAGPRPLQRAQRKVAGLMAGKATQAEFDALRQSHENVLAELRATQESLVQTQQSLVQTQESLAQTQHSLAETQRSLTDTQYALTQADQRIAYLDSRRRAVDDDLGGIDRAAQGMPVLADAVRTLLTQPQVTGVADVTVIVTTCDRERLLDRALRSLSRQYRLPAQVVVVDDGSVSAEPVVQAYRDLLPHIDLVRTPGPRSGAAMARNVGLDAARESVITYLDDDNEMAPGWVAAVSEHFAAHPNSTAAYGGQLRGDVASTSGVLFADLAKVPLTEQNSLDTGVLAHRPTTIRWNAALRRLNDWDFALSLAAAYPMDPLPRLASIYDADSERRISHRGSFRLYRDSVRHKHGAGPLPDEGICCLCDFRGPFGPGPSGQPLASCPNCAALARHRLLALLLPSLSPTLVAAGLTTSVEVAPFTSSPALFTHNGMHLVSLDADPQADNRHVDLIGDLLHLPIDDRSLPLLLVSHVLEHVEDDRQAIAEIARVLLPAGVAVVQVPLRADGQPTEEDVTASEEQRIARFGQRDHVRLYGLDIIDRFRAAGLSVHTVAAIDVCPDPLVVDYRLNPDEPYFLLHREEDCGERCWIEESLAVATSVARELDAYLA